MADKIDPKKDNKDAESGEPVQLDEDLQQGGEEQPPQQPGQQQSEQKPGQQQRNRPQPGQQQGGGLKR
jgi:hypothetical protein